MPRASASVRVAESRTGDIVSDYVAHLARTGRGTRNAEANAQRFLRRWPEPQRWAEQPLPDRLSEGPNTRSFLTFLIVFGHIRPGYDYLISRKLASFWREIVGCSLEEDMTRFCEAAQSIGYTPINAWRSASQSVGRLLIQSGRRLDELTLADFEELTAACRSQEEATGEGKRHYHSALSCAHRVLFHLEIVDTPPPHWQGPESYQKRMADVAAALRPAFVAYLERKAATCREKTVTGIATRLAHFGRFLDQIDPDLSSLTELDRERHIEPYLNSLPTAVHSKTGEPISTAEQDRRIRAVSGFLSEITEWGWEQAPGRKLVFRSDMPRLPRVLPRYLPVDADRRLSEELERSEYRQAADALLLQRACGLRIGELLDLELDCVHEIPGNGAWLKVPLGKLDTERMVPLDDETVALIDRIVATRSEGRPLPHPRTRRRVQFLFTHHGRRLGQAALRLELDRAAKEAGLGHVTSHQLRHTFATAMVNAGVSLQSLMALLGHVSAEMSLRYGRLFDQTVRAEYERALELAKARIGPLPDNKRRIPLRGDGDWRHAPAIKSRLAGGYCVRAPAQGACLYANICEHCPSFRADAASVSVLAAQRVDAEALVEDAEARGWIEEADRHRRLIARLDALLGEAEAG
jgi:integrase